MGVFVFVGTNPDLPPPPKPVPASYFSPHSSLLTASPTGIDARRLPTIFDCHCYTEVYRKEKAKPE
ncbi:hypothetical protein SOVF_038640 [Spinacia oleracea]|nr:hypothetical protein SOVF_038640 [Spinacia oleracea]